MSIFRITKGRAIVGSLYVGEGPSDGGAGGKNSTFDSAATPVALKGISAFTVNINAAALSGTSLSFATGVSQVAVLTIGGANVNPGTGTLAAPVSGATAPSGTANDGGLAFGSTTAIPPEIPIAADAIIAIPPQNVIATGLTWNAFVTAQNTVKLVITNGTGGTLVLPAGQWTFLLLRLISA